MKPILLISLTAVLFFWKVFLGERYFFGDNFYLEIPNLIFFQNSIRNGVFPLWNPYLFGGIPFFGDINIPVFHPLTLFLPFFKAEDWLSFSIITSTFLCGVFTYLFIKETGRSNPESFLGSLIFMFSATTLSYANNFPLLSSSVWLPISFFLTEKFLNTKKRKHILLLGVITALQFMSGHIQPTYYTVGLLVIYILFSNKIFVKEKIKVFLLWFFVAVMISLPVLASFLNFANNSTRTAFTYELSTDSSLHPLFLIRFFIPKFFSDPKLGFSWGPAWRSVLDNTAYFGITPLIFILSFAVFSRNKSRQDKFFIAVSLISVLIALGRYTPVFLIFYKLAPFFSRLRVPTQILLIFNFSMSFIFASSIRWFLNKSTSVRQQKKHRKLHIYHSLSLSAIFLSLIVLIRTRSEVFFEKIYPFFQNFLAKSSFHNLPKDQVIFTHTIDIFLLSGLFIVGTLILLLHRLPTKKTLALVFLLVFSDLYLQNSEYIITEKPIMYQVNSKVAVFLKERIGNHRYLSLDEYLPYTGLSVYWENMVFRPPFVPSLFDEKEKQDFRILKQRVTSLSPNWGMKYSLPTINGYSSMVLAPYSKYLKTNPNIVDVNYVDAPSLDDKRLDVLGVKYVVVDKTINTFPDDLEEKFLKVYEDDQNAIYENKNVWPRAFLWDGQKVASGSAKIKKYTPNSVTIEAETKEDHLELVLTDTYHPGWEAFVDNQKIIIGKFMETFRTVKFPKGKHEVLFEYLPKIF